MKIKLLSILQIGSTVWRSVQMGKPSQAVVATALCCGGCVNTD